MIFLKDGSQPRLSFFKLTIVYIHGFVLMLLVSSFTNAETSVWRVHDGEREMYIGGTVHVLAKQDYPLPQAFTRAFSNSDLIYFETDIGALSSLTHQFRIAEKLIYPAETSLKDFLSQPTYALLEQYCLDRGIPLAGIVRMKPGLASTTLLMLELQQLGLAGAGVDQHFFDKAIDDEKTVNHLESVESQLELMVNMGAGYEDQFIRNTISEMESLEAVMSDIKQAWRRGDRKRLVNSLLIPMREDLPQLYTDLVVKRNNEWLVQLESFLKTPATEFVLVGVLHLVGEEGVLQQLQKRGFRIDSY